MIDCISMYQPWAQWVRLGWKTVETRRHDRFACLSGKRIIIHAAKKWDPFWSDRACGWLTSDQYNDTVDYGDLWPRGALICTAQVVSHNQLGSPASPFALCDCSGGTLFGLVLSIHGELSFDPIKWKGHQGIMKVPDEVITDAVR